MDLALNNLQRLISHKTQPTKGISLNFKMIVWLEFGLTYEVIYDVVAQYVKRYVTWTIFFWICMSL